VDDIYIAEKIGFKSFTFLAVLKSTELYNTSYFSNGAIMGMAYPTSNWD
jgi:hypothetical protein